MLLMVFGMVFLVLCLATDKNDSLFLCLALGSTALGNFLNLYIHRKLS